MKTAAVLYTLITVTNGAAVHQESGFKSLRTCEQAKSLALYGLSIEDREAREAEAKRKAEEAKKAEAERRAKWEAEHPPRLPKDDCEKAVAAGVTMDPSSCYRVQYVSKGIVRDIDPQEPGIWLGGYSLITMPPDPNSIKIALCVIEP